MQNLTYALIQLLHNFGAAAVIGIPVYALIVGHEGRGRHRAFAAIGAAWLVQLATGFGFGVASLAFYGHLPDIHGVAIVALFIKIACTFMALAIILLFWKKGRTYTPRGVSMIWVIWLLLGAIALSSAAFLRWFS